MADGKWKDNKDGTWSRMVGDNEETTSVNPNTTEGALAAAEELGVDLNSIKGSGAEGKITKADVEGAATE